MIRNILAIVVGYLIFVVTSLAFFKISGQRPHSEATIVFMIITAIYGVVSSFACGYIAQLISKPKNLTINYILAIIIAGFATFSYFKAEGSHWTQLLAIFIFAPVSVLGGRYLLSSITRARRL